MTVATNALVDAVAAARDDKPDMIVLDVMMPGLNGVEACRQLRTRTDAYVIMLTARAEGVDMPIGGTSVTLPAGLARILRIEEREQRRYSDRNAALLGALTFFLPCGSTQTEQLFALSASSTRAPGPGHGPRRTGPGGGTRVARGHPAQPLGREGRMMLA